MTPEIAIVLAILLAAIVIFVTERNRVDIVALMVLVSLAPVGLVTPAEALSSYANSAVKTVWAVLILSAGYAHRDRYPTPAHRAPTSQTAAST